VLRDTSCRSVRKGGTCDGRGAEDGLPHNGMKRASSPRMALFGWLAYGTVTTVRSVLESGARRRTGGPVRTGTEEDFRKDEARFAEDERRLDEADRSAKKK
jgi:hypothetical protein